MQLLSIHRKGMITFLMALACCVLTTMAWSAPRSASDAVNAARGWLQGNLYPMDSTLTSDISGVDAYFDNGLPMYYVVNMLSGGYIIVAGDDLVEPIVAFSDNGTYEPISENPLYVLANSDLKHRVTVANEMVEKVAASGGEMQLFPEMIDAQNRWNTYLSRVTPIPIPMGLSNISDIRVATLVATRWSQGSVNTGYCYNYYTPNHYVDGCVATAMAQVFKYHQHPNTGVGTGSFTIYVDGVSRTANLRGGNGSGGVYDWANMVNIPTNATDTQRKAIGALCSDCGVATNMQYTSGASGTWVYATNLKGTFKYANAVETWYPSVGATLNKMLNPSLNAGLPSLFAVHDSSSGHEIVCDGYGYNSTTIYHHFNLGWSGSYDAWYNLPTIDAGYNFNQVTQVIYNIMPTQTGEIISGRVLNSTGAVVSGVTVTATKGSTNYSAVTNAKGIYAIFPVPANSSYTVTGAKTGKTYTTTTCSTGTSNSSSSGSLWEVNLTENAGPVLLTSTTALNVPEGGLAALGIKLSAQPSSSVVVTTTKSSGDADITIQSGSSLTFTTSNWNNYQFVYLQAAEDIDKLNGVANFTVASSGLTSIAVTATEIDNEPPGDNYELDNTPEMAVAIINNGVKQSHTIEPANDKDYLKFFAVDGQTYTIETFGTTDTVIYLYGPDGITQLAYNDDGGTFPNGKIIFTAPAMGYYYAMVKNYSATATGAYEVSVTGPATTITGTIELTSQYNPSRINGKAVMFYIYNSATQELLDMKQATLNSQSKYTITTAYTLPVDIRVKTQHWLAKKRMGIMVGGGSVVVDFTGDFALPNGDTNGDNVIDDFDLNNVNGSFGATAPFGNAWFDLTEDDVIDDFDLNIVNGSFGMMGDN